MDYMKKQNKLDCAYTLYKEDMSTIELQKVITNGFNILNSIRKLPPICFTMGNLKECTGFIWIVFQYADLNFDHKRGTLFSTYFIWILKCKYINYLIEENKRKLRIDQISGEIKFSLANFSEISTSKYQEIMEENAIYPVDAILDNVLYKDISNLLIENHEYPKKSSKHISLFLRGEIEKKELARRIFQLACSEVEGEGDGVFGLKTKFSTQRITKDLKTVYNLCYNKK